jgi:hypothetical protein
MKTARNFASGLFHAWFRHECAAALGKMMANDNSKTKDAASKKQPAHESKTAAAAPKTSDVKTSDIKASDVKTADVKADGVKAEAATPDAAPSRKGMGEGQKPVTQAYKDNWNAIFAEKSGKKIAKKKR